MQRLLLCEFEHEYHTHENLTTCFHLVVMVYQPNTIRVLAGVKIRYFTPGVCWNKIEIARTNDEYKVPGIRYIPRTCLLLYECIFIADYCCAALKKKNGQMWTRGTETDGQPVRSYFLKGTHLPLTTTSVLLGVGRVIDGRFRPATASFFFRCFFRVFSLSEHMYR